MNARTSKLIRRFCVARKVDYQRAKHYYKKLPRIQRHAARISMLPLPEYHSIRELGWKRYKELFPESVA